MASDLKKAHKDKEIETFCYSIGFSQEHDANLLNFITKSGSQQGEFFYIDFNSKVTK